MLLASSTPTVRPLHRADHMGEPTPSNQTSLLIPLPDLCVSVTKEGGEGIKADIITPLAPSLRPRTDSSASAAVVCLPEGDTLKTTTCAFTPEAVATAIKHGNEETYTTNDTPAKVVTATSHGAAVTEANSAEEEVEVAVREEDEDNKNDEDSVSQSQRQSPSPSSSFVTPSKKPLASALRNSSSPLDSSIKGRNYRTRRRIRGIWGDDNDSLFSELHDETLLLIMKYLSMKDLCIASMVCQRWKHVSLHQDSWKRLDATDFVKAAYDHYAGTAKSNSTENPAGQSPEAPKSTSLALAARMEKNSPLVLEIRSIQHRLSADNFLSSLPSLQELTLTSFDELTDTHIHVLLLSSSCKNVQARSGRSCVLRKLVLEQCPRLTDAVIQSIGKFCPELEELNLKGNPKISDLSPLKELWHLVKKPARLAAPAVTRPSPPASLSAMAMLFSGPPPLPPAPAPAPAPSPPRPSTPTNSLQSLFAPPGQSPPRATNVITLLPRSLTRGSSTIEPGKLTRINVSNTGVSSKSLLAAWKTIPPGNCLRLEQVIMEGTGETWNDALLRELADNLELTKLQSLNIGCSPSSTSTRVTDKGFRSLLVEKDSLRLLKQLNLSGHASLTGTCVSEVLTVASLLEEVVLDGCKGLSSKSSNAAKDFANCDALAKALLKCTTRDINNNKTNNNRKDDNKNDNNGGRGLRRLSLSRCFSNQSKLQRNSNLQIHEETLGSILLEAMGPPKPKKQKKKQQTNLCDDPAASCTTKTQPTTTIATLQELDLTDCWFVTSTDIASLRKRCPGLDRIHLKGTRADSSS